MRLHAEMSLIAFLRLVHLAIPFAFPILAPADRIHLQCHQRPSSRHEKGLLLREGTIVDATLIAAPTSTKTSRRRNLSNVVASGAASRARSIPTKRRMAWLSYRASTQDAFDQGFLNAIEAAFTASASIGPLTIWSMSSFGMLGSATAGFFLLVLLGIHAPSG